MIVLVNSSNVWRHHSMDENGNQPKTNPEDLYYDLYRSERESMTGTKRLTILFGLFLVILGLIAGITTLVYMGHNQHWEDIHDELIATPIIVGGFGTALFSLIWTWIVVER
jgi:hypothetical protein